MSAGVASGARLSSLALALPTTHAPRSLRVTFTSRTVPTGFTSFTKAAGAFARSPTRARSTRGASGSGDVT